MSKLKGLLWIILTFAVAGILVLNIQGLAHAIPFGVEKKLANIIHEPEKKICSNSKIDPILNKLVQRIYPLNKEDHKFPISITIVHSDEVNAYAGLGGKIIVTSGFLKQAHSSEEIAGVLAHEIAHVENRHIMEGVINQLFTVGGIKIIFSGESLSSSMVEYLLSSRFTRIQEYEADKKGLERLKQAKISNKGFIDFFRRVHESSSFPEFISDHPSNQSRIDSAQDIEEYPSEELLTKEQWNSLKKICD